MNIVLSLANQHNQLEAFQNELESKLREGGFSVDLIEDMRLIAEEILVNTISYGYEQGQNSLIEVELQVLSVETITLEFRDEGKAYNPLDTPDRDVEDERIGGWGIPLLKALTDDIQYKRIDGQNVLTLKRSERVHSDD